MICKRNENQQSSVIGNDFVDIPQILDLREFCFFSQVEVGFD